MKTVISFQMTMKLAARKAPIVGPWWKITWPTLVYFVLLQAEFAFGEVTQPANSLSDDFVVHVYDDWRNRFPGVSVTVEVSVTDGPPTTLTNISDGRGQSRFALPPRCEQIVVIVKKEPWERRTAARACSRIRDVYLVLPGPADSEQLPQMRDATGRLLPPPPPALLNTPRVVDRAFAARYVEPGLFGLNAGVGLNLCVPTGEGAVCSEDMPVGFSSTLSVLVYVTRFWKVAAAAGINGQYQLSRHDLAADGEDDMNHLIGLGPEILLVGISGDWLFGVRTVPFGFLYRISNEKSLDGIDSGNQFVRQTSDSGAAVCAGGFLGWRAWGHVPIGLYVDVWYPISLYDSSRFPPLSLSLGVFAGRRFGPGRSLWESD